MNIGDVYTLLDFPYNESPRKIIIRDIEKNIIWVSHHSNSQPYQWFSIQTTYFQNYYRFDQKLTDEYTIKDIIE